MELANSILTLQPGIYILRHPKTGLPPISISRAAGSAAHHGRVEALYTPGTHGGILRESKDCIVMQVLDAPVDLLVTAYLEVAGATVPSLKVDKIKLQEDLLAEPKPIAVPPEGISLIGHIERIGDVVAIGGNRLGDPETNLRLEGFQVMWPNKPTGVDLSYSARVEGGGSTATVSTGKFCGTRNAARRIVEVTFTLMGTKAAEFALKGTAYFSGGYQMEISSAMPLSGPTGVEHLTALEIGVMKFSDDKPSKRAWEPSSRTRVFRNKK